MIYISIIIKTIHLFTILINYTHKQQILNMCSEDLTDLEEMIKNIDIACEKNQKKQTNNVHEVENVVFV